MLSVKIFCVYYLQGQKPFLKNNYERCNLISPYKLLKNKYPCYIFEYFIIFLSKKLLNLFIINISILLMNNTNANVLMQIGTLNSEII